MSLSLPLVILLLIRSTFGFYHADPSHQEIDLYDWSSGARMQYCSNTSMAEVGYTFRKHFSQIVTRYCKRNLTLCNLKHEVQFKEVHVMYLDGFPRREYSFVNLKFAVIYPHNTELQIKNRDTMPLMPRKTLCDILTVYGDILQENLKWNNMTFERYPRYDQATEFMNIAIIPILVFCIPLMIFLAYWTSTFRPNMSSESWLVTGATGGKNFAYRRTLEIIAEQNAEIDRQNRYARTKDLPILTPGVALAHSSGMLMDVARHTTKYIPPPAPSLHNYKYSTVSQTQPQIFVLPSSKTVSEASITIEPPLTAPSPHALGLPSLEEDEDDIPPPPPPPPPSDVPTRHTPTPPSAHYSGYHRPFKTSSRRQSSVEEIKEKRRHRGASTSSGSQRPTKWKAGSLILFGGRKK